MLDLKNLEKNFEEVSSKLQKKKVDEQIIAELREIFVALKNKRAEQESIKAEQNKKSKLFGEYKREKRDIAPLQAELATLKEQGASLQNEVRDIEAELEVYATNIPNIPDESVPNGNDEEDNVEIKKVLTPPSFDFEPKNHYELDGWIDFERGVKIAKSRFSLLRGMGARVERALINYMLDFNRQRGFEEVYVPFMANEESLFATGQLPKFENDLFKVEDEPLYLIPTAEVSLTNIVRDEILVKEELPLKFTSYTPCFRKEAGSAGRDTRGMIRQHQFDKVELVSITTQEQSEEVFEQMVSCASDLLSSLGLAHRMIELCGGDLGFSAARTIDLEVWFPGQNRYREISSISNTRDFQARRGKIRYKAGKQNILCHTLNGSSLAVGRCLIAIMENYQAGDGTIKIPEVLQKYL
jgi:seryl-tRNA synthetase